MDKKIRTIQECKKIATQQKYKHVRLLSLDETVICSWNPSHGKTTFANKMEEIERRLQQYEPGIYILQYRARFSGKEPIQSFYLGWKNYNPADLQDAPVKNSAAPVAPVAEEKRSRVDKLLSVETALDYATENATLKAENESLRDQVAKLKKEVTELEAELETSDEEKLTVGENKNGLEKFAEQLGTILTPVLDRAFDHAERKQKFQETKFLADQGYRLPGLDYVGKGNNQHNGNKRQRDFNVNIPTTDEPDFQNYLQWLEGLDDDAFTEHLEKVKAADENIYNVICKAFDVSFEEDEQK